MAASLRMTSRMSQSPDMDEQGIPTAPGAGSVIVIHPHRGWVALNLRELWAYRELAYFFVWRDLKVRYKQTAFGALWAVIQPFMLMVVFTLFLGRIEGIAPEGIPYPLFAFAGLVPWTLFSQSLIGSSNSLVGASNLIEKVAPVHGRGHDGDKGPMHRSSTAASVGPMVPMIGEARGGPGDPCPLEMPQSPRP